MPKGIFGNRGKPSICHPELPNYAFGKCISCARKESYAKEVQGNPYSVYRRRLLKRLYNSSPEEYDKLFQDQDGKCAICGSSEPRQGTTKHFHIDHNHETKKVRGLLCGPCNRGIGYLQDDPELVMKAYQYLIVEIKK